MPPLKDKPKRVDFQPITTEVRGRHTAKLADGHLDRNVSLGAYDHGNRRFEAYGLKQ